jgi:hypothetical protein
LFADVVQHGGVNADAMINGETQKTLGDAVSGDLYKGNAAANEVIGVSNDMHETMSQAKVVVYWAITDLCPDQVGQRPDRCRRLRRQAGGITDSGRRLSIGPWDSPDVVLDASPGRFSAEKRAQIEGFIDELLAALAGRASGHQTPAIY